MEDILQNRALTPCPVKQLQNRNGSGAACVAGMRAMRPGAEERVAAAGARD
jgi:hypothetical protein